MIKTFNFYGEEANDTVIEMLQDFCLKNLDVQDFIIDITRNSGGSTEIWAMALLRCLRGKLCPSRM